MTARIWEVQLARVAVQDFEEIVLWTEAQFGELQSAEYEETITRAVEALIEGPAVIGSKPRPELGKGVYTLHVARKRRHGRHFLIYSATAPGVIEVARILHDSADLARHLPAADEGDA